MEKIIFILIMILYDNNNFYKNIKEITPNNYDFVVNKNYKLSEYYTPPDLETISLEYSCKDKYLRHEARISFEEMAKSAKKEGFNIIAVSAYRSYEYQQKLYINYVKDLGKFRADIASARPGHSEHQTGLSIDISDLSLDYDNFENTLEFHWIKNNAHKYGFIMRYPKAKYNITGFKYEPWHYRYVGKNIAKIIYKKNITLEEYKQMTK